MFGLHKKILEPRRDILVAVKNNFIVQTNKYFDKMGLNGSKLGDFMIDWFTMLIECSLARVGKRVVSEVLKS